MIRNKANIGQKEDLLDFIEKDSWSLIALLKTDIHIL